MQAIDPNWQYNVSKKIAQLTKVIFRLHTEGIDRRDSIAKLKRAQDKEIEEIRNVVDQRVQEFRDNLAKEYEETQKETKEKYEEMYNTVKSQYESETKKLQEKAASITSITKEQIEILQKQIKNLTDQLEYQRTNFKQSLTQARDHFSDTVEDLKQKHQQELENVITESNLKYNKLVVESAKKEDELRAQISAADKELEAKKIQELVNQVSKLKTTNLELDNNLRAAEQEKNKLAKSNKQLQEKLTKLEENVSKYKDSLKSQAADKEEIENLKNKLRAEQSRYSTDTQLLRQQLEDTIQKFRQEISEREDSSNKMKALLESDIQKLQEQLKDSSSQSNEEHKKIIKNLTDEIDRLQNKMTFMEAESHKTEADLRSMIVDLKSQLRDVASINEKAIEAERTQSSNSIAIIMKSHAAEVQELKDQIEALNRDNKIAMDNANLKFRDEKDGYMAQIAQLNSTITQLKSEYERKISKLEKEKESETKSIYENSENSKNSLIKAYERRLKALEEQLALEKEQMKVMQETQLKQLDEKYALSIRLNNEKLKKEFEVEKSESLSQQRDNYEHDIKELKDQIENLQHTNNFLEEQIGQQMHDYEEKLLTLKSQIKKLQDEKHRMEKDFKMSMDEKDVILKGQIEENNSLFNDKMAEIEKQHTEEILNLKKEFSKSMSLRQNEFSQKSKDYETKIKELQDNIDSMHTQMDDMHKKHYDELAAAEKKFTDLQVTMSAVEANMQQSSKDQIKLLQLEIEDLKKKYQFNESHQNKEIDKLILQIQQNKIEHEKKYLSMEHQFDLTKNELELQKNTQISLLKSEHEVKIGEMQKKIDDLEMHHKNEIDNLHKDHENKLNEFDDQRKEELKKLLDEFDEIEDGYKADIEKLNGELEKTKKENSELLKKVELMGSTIADQQKIKELEKRVFESNDMVAKLFNELKHYQQEFANREQSYNKIFNTKPQVGVLNVLERRMKKDTLDRSLPPLSEAIEKAEAKSKRASTVISARRSKPK